MGTMKLVLFPVDTSITANAVHDNEAAAAALMNGASCTAKASGQSMGAPAAAGSCFELQVSQSSDDSEFMIDASGLTGIAVFAQHVPIEFERDRHYFYDQSTSAFDIEPVFEEGVGVPYMYFDCSADGSRITFGEHCGDCTESFDINSCGESGANVAADGTDCFTVPEENNLVHTVSCAKNSNNVMIASVNVFVDAANCAAVTSTTVPTEVHEHVSGVCEQTAHEHGDAASVIPYEWAGVFSLSGADLTQDVVWSMQADAAGDYPDQTMKLVLFPVDTSITANAVHDNEAAAAALMNGASCTAKASGQSMGAPAAA